MNDEDQEQLDHCDDWRDLDDLQEGKKEWSDFDQERENDLRQKLAEKVRSRVQQVRWLVAAALIVASGAVYFGYQWQEEKEKNKLVRALEEENGEQGSSIKY